MIDETLTMIPGPTPVHPRILAALSRPTVSHVAPAFAHVFTQALADFRTLCQSATGQPFIVAGSGTLAMEMALVNVVAPGQTVLVISHGYFGDRYVELAAAFGIQCDVLQSEWGHAVPPEEVEEARHRRPTRRSRSRTSTRRPAPGRPSRPTASCCRAARSSSSSTACAPPAASTSPSTSGASTCCSPPPRRRSAPLRDWRSACSRRVRWRAVARYAPCRPTTRTCCAGSRSWRTRRSTTRRRASTRSSRSPRRSGSSTKKGCRPASRGTRAPPGRSARASRRSGSRSSPRQTAAPTRSPSCSFPPASTTRPSARAWRPAAS